MTIYSLDTSAILDGLVRFYPLDTFPQLWDNIDGTIAEGRVIASEEVWEEINEKADVAKSWASARRSSLFVPTDTTIATRVANLLSEHERLVMQLKNRNRADPFVIALAELRGATVVTGEGSDGTARRPKIPYVCQQRNIPCIRFLEFIQAEGWTF